VLLLAELIVNVDFIKSPDFICSEKLITLCVWLDC
jgi:hypothetical protein